MWSTALERSHGRVSAGVLAVDLAIGVLRSFKMRTLPAWLAHAPRLLLRPTFLFLAVTSIFHTIHALTVTAKFVVAAEA
jgi:hypothetical protein